MYQRERHYFTLYNLNLTCVLFIQILYMLKEINKYSHFKWYRTKSIGSWMTLPCPSTCRPFQQMQTGISSNNTSLHNHLYLYTHSQLSLLTLIIHVTLSNPPQYPPDNFFYTFLFSFSSHFFFFPLWIKHSRDIRPLHSIHPHACSFMVS